MTRNRLMLATPLFAGAFALIQHAATPQWDSASSRTTRYRIRVVAEGLSGPTGLATRNGALFVALRPGPGDQDASVVRLDPATGSRTLLLEGLDAPASFALGRTGEILWTRGDGALLSQPYPGSIPRALRADLRFPGAVAAGAEGSAFWVEDLRNERSPDAIGIRSLDGGRTRIVVAAGARPSALATGPGGDVYWVNAAEGLLQRVRAGGRNEVLLRGLRNPSSLALSPDGRTLFFTEVPTPGIGAEAGGTNTVNAFSLETFTRTLVSRGDPDPAGLAAGDGGRVYWAVTSRGLVLEAIPEYSAEGSASLGSEAWVAKKIRVALSGAEETPPVVTSATGSAKFDMEAAKPRDDDEDEDEADDDDSEPGRREADDEEGLSDRPYLKYAVKAKNLFGFTAAHIHVGAPGQSGPVVAPLEARESRKFENGEVELEGKIRPSDLTGPMAGDWEAFAAALAGGGLYVNLHTTTHPGGEIRGQIAASENPANQPPNATITSPPGDVTVTVGAAVSFAGTASDPNGDPVTVLWDFGDGGTSAALVHGDHVYTTAGTYDVSLTATDSAGLPDPTPAHVLVTVIPAGENRPPDGTIGTPADDVTIFAGQSVSFAGVATDPDGDTVSVLWSFGDGSSSTELIPGDHTYAVAGTFTVTFTVTDSSGLADPAPDSRTITVQPVTTNLPPVGTIVSPPGNVTIVAGGTVFFSGASTDPNGDTVTVAWDFGDGSTSTVPVPGDHTYASAGTYTVTFTATDSGGLSDPTPDTRTVTVAAGAPNQPPDGTITSPPGTVAITAGQSVSFSGTASDPDGDAVTVRWDFGDGTTSNALMPGAHVYASPGTYLVLFTATDSKGLADPSPDTRTINVEAAPPAATLTAVQTQVFTPKCTGCHGGASPTAGMDLVSGQSWANLVNVPATTQAGTRVVPGQPQNSVLYTFLVAGHRSGSVTDADRQLISSWITAGAQDN